MARDITVLGEHSLNVANREELTREIAERFETNVVYAVYDSYGWFKDKLLSFTKAGIQNYDDDFSVDQHYILHRCDKFDNNKCPLIIMDDDYSYEWYLGEYGDKAYHREEFIKVAGPPTEDCIRFINGFIENQSMLSFDGPDFSCFLHEHTIDVSPPYYFTDFTNFFYLLFRKESMHGGYFQNKAYFEKLLALRNSNIQTIQKLGGDKLYYIDDSGRNPNSALKVDESSATWQEIEESLSSNSAKSQIADLHQLLTNKEYLQSLQKRAKNVNSFSCFYDNLSPLSYEDIIPWEDESARCF